MNTHICAQLIASFRTAHTHTCAYITHTCVYIHTHMRVHTHTHARTYTHTAHAPHTHAHTLCTLQTYTHTHTLHAHTHARTTHTRYMHAHYALHKRMQCMHCYCPLSLTAPFTFTWIPVWAIDVLVCMSKILHLV